MNPEQPSPRADKVRYEGEEDDPDYSGGEESADSSAGDHKPIRRSERLGHKPPSHLPPGDILSGDILSGDEDSSNNGDYEWEPPEEKPGRGRERTPPRVKPERQPARQQSLLPTPLPNWLREPPLPTGSKLCHAWPQVHPGVFPAPSAPNLTSLSLRETWARVKTPPGAFESAQDQPPP